MTKMNPSTLLGMISGVAIIFTSIFLSAEDITIFINLPGVFIVVGGTLSATLLSYPLQEVLRVFKTLLVVLRNERQYAEDDQKELVAISLLLLKANMADIEQALGKIKNPFLHTGIQLVIDNTPITEIIELLEWRIFKLKTREAAEAQIYRSMAMYAPAFGMLGTLIGLVNMLYNMGDSAMELIGINMGLALLTTLYGVTLSNLLLKPIALKFERRTEQRILLMNTIMEGVLLLARGHSPSYIREYLKTFVELNENELRIINTQPSSSVNKKRKS